MTDKEETQPQEVQTQMQSPLDQIDVSTALENLGKVVDQHTGPNGATFKAIFISYEVVKNFVNSHLGETESQG